MDGKTFDRWTASLMRVLTDAGSRRRAVILSAGGLAGLWRLGVADESAAKKRKHRRHKKKKKNKNKNQSPPPPPLPDTCTNTVKDGAETDIDCGGGTCPRCQGGQICTSRNDCHTALCTGGTCQSCAAPSDCGLDSNGDTCFCRDNAAKPGEKMCTRQLCTLFAGPNCANCTAGQQCAPANGGADRECCTPCGTP
jgi:hypothetical protein